MPSLPLWKKVLFGIFTVVLFFSGTELGLTLLGVKPLIVTEDPFVGFAGHIPLFVEQAGSDGTVMLRTARNKLGRFNDQQFPKVKSKNTYRIFCMGGSNTYGHPFDDATSFCGWLREYLPAADPSKHWEVVNAGGISYASYRVAGLMEELSQYRPDLFIVYDGQNEFLEERTYRNIINLPEWVVSAKVSLARTRLYTIVNKGAEYITRKLNGSAAPKKQMSPEVAEILNNSVGPTAYTRNDLLGKKIITQFKFNLRRMITIAASAGSNIVFINPASNLKDMSPFKSENRDGLAGVELKQWSLRYDEGKRLQTAGKTTDALAHYTEAGRIDDRYADLQFRTGECLFALRRYDEAKRSFQKAIDEDTCPLRILTPMSTIVREVTAEQHVPLVDFVKLLEDDCSRQYGHRILGKEYFLDHVHPTMAGNRMLGLALIDELAKRGIVKTGAQWNDAARAAIARTVEQRVDRKKKAYALMILGKTLDWAGRVEEGRHLLLQAFGMLGDNSFNVLSELANSSVRRGRIPEAIDYYRKALRFSPDDAKLHDDIAYYLEKEGKLKEALAHYAEALRISAAAKQARGAGPESDDRSAVDAHYKIARILSAQGRTDEAIAQYREVLQTNPSEITAEINMGILLEKQGRIPEAVSHLQTALRFDPTSTLGNYNLAKVFDRQGRFDDAIKHYQAVLNRDPGSADAHNNLGVVFARQGRVADSIVHFNEALSIDRDNIQAHYNLGLAFAMQGKKNDSDFHFAEANRVKSLQTAAKPGDVRKNSE